MSTDNNLSPEKWVCKHCGQRNSSWAEQCGRCGDHLRDEITSEEMPRPKRRDAKTLVNLSEEAYYCAIYEDETKQTDWLEARITELETHLAMTQRHLDVSRRRQGEIESELTVAFAGVASRNAVIACKDDRIAELERELADARKGEAQSDRIALHWQREANELRKRQSLEPKDGPCPSPSYGHPAEGIPHADNCQQAHHETCEHPTDQVQSGIAANGVNVPPVCMQCGQKVRSPDVEFSLQPDETNERNAFCCDINASYPGKHRGGCPALETGERNGS